jgi:glutathione synthase/RimK-type ligase-like ATP-grasp enzyme
MTQRRPLVLLVTETSDLAADLLVLAAKERSIVLHRFNQDEFPQRASIVWQSNGQTHFACEGRTFAENDVSGAWFRRNPPRKSHQDPTLAFATRETEGFLGGVWETAPWFWMNAPAAAARAEHKLLQLRYAQELGFTVPATLATNCPDAARRFVRAAAIATAPAIATTPAVAETPAVAKTPTIAKTPAIAKTLVGGKLTIDGTDHAIFTSAVTAEDLNADDEILACPVIFQSRIETHFDLRVTVVGNQVFAARIFLRNRTQHDLDWRRTDPTRLYYERHVLSPELESKCTKLVAAMGLTYGALDFVVTPQGEHVFLELNPAGQWGWIEQALGFPITNAILDRLTEEQSCAR